MRHCFLTNEYEALIENHTPKKRKEVEELIGVIVNCLLLFKINVKGEGELSIGIDGLLAKGAVAQNTLFI